MERESFIFFRSFLNSAKCLEDEERLAFYDAIAAYGLDGEEIAESPVTKALMEGAKPIVNNASKRYQASVENGKKGGRPKTQDNPSETQEKPRKTQKNLGEPNPNLNVDVDVNDDVNENENDNDNGDKKKKERGKAPKKKPSGIFTPPAVADVLAYCAERGNSVDAERFVDHYTANGWMRGKNKIKDWKACVRTWEKQDAERGAGMGSPQGASARGNVFLDIAMEGEDLF